MHISLDCRHLLDSILYFVLHAHDTSLTQEIDTEGTIASKVLEEGGGVLKIIGGAAYGVGPSTGREIVGATPKASMGEGLEGVYPFQNLDFIEIMKTLDAIWSLSPIY